MIISSIFVPRKPIRQAKPLLVCFATLCLWWLSPQIQAQKQYSVQVVDVQNKLPADVVRKEQFSSYRHRYLWLQEMQLEMFRRGYLSFSVDRIVESGYHWNVYIYTGDIFSWAKLSRGNLDEETLGSIRFRDKIFYERSFNPNQVSELFESILTYCENNGHPFATVHLDSTHLEENRLSASIRLNKNQLIQLDSVVVRGSTKTHPNYFQNYLELKPNMRYNERTITAVDGLLEDLAFVDIIRPTEVIFSEKNTKVVLYLNERKASRFDGILGIQPDEFTGKIGITGDVKLELQNAFNRGETISLNWRRLQTATQDINVQFKYPYLLNSPIGADLGFSLYRRDTSFVQISAQIGAAYQFSGRSHVKVFYEPRQSNVISKVIAPSQGMANSQSNLFGLEAQTSRLNYRINPTRGHELTLSGAAGSRSIRKNPELDEVFYEDIPLKSTQWNSTLLARIFTLITPRNTVMLGVKGAITQNPNMFRNEVFRIGGMSTIRGFDEESIFASAYGIFTAEYRFLLERNSYLFAFFDGGWYELNVTDGYLRDTPLGFGLGITFETRAGMFSLTYALGKQFDNPILLRNGKIHFGFVSFF